MADGSLEVPTLRRCTSYTGGELESMHGELAGGTREIERPRLFMAVLSLYRYFRGAGKESGIFTMNFGTRRGGNSYGTR